MFQAIAGKTNADIFGVVRSMNDFLDASGYTKKYMIRARASTDPYIGENADIAILDDEKAPSDEEQAVIIKALHVNLSQKFGVEVDADDKPEFLRTVEGRIPSRGSKAFARLNPDANARYIKQAGL